MDFIEVVFYTQFIAVIALFFYKLYNLMNAGKSIGEFKVVILTLIGLILAYGLGNMLNIVNHTVAFATVINFERLPFLLGVFCFIGELFLKIDYDMKSKTQGARNSQEDSRREV